MGRKAYSERGPNGRQAMPSRRRRPNRAIGRSARAGRVGAPAGDAASAIEATGKRRPAAVRQRDTRRARMKQVRVLASITAASFLVGATAFAQTDPKKVERAWKAKCSSCHGAAGKGDTEKGQQMKIADMTSAEFQARKDDEFRNAILNGVQEGEGRREAGDGLLQGRPDARAGRRAHRLHPRVQEVVALHTRERADARAGRRARRLRPHVQEVARTTGQAPPPGPGPALLRSPQTTLNILASRPSIR